ncbi:hypothetical protein CN271_06980 [Bacillus cereus]|uniref:hypothetical protein n=1 Tax=Bacillus cereus TaxID=1396 RepID=UPI000BED540F|nr:hypothetical protein [Bacillus cereus]PEE33600.1 hypothetical protein CON59_24740 [Bacillus cereus]PET45018.1 hypothetical protein CN523_17250 [Bacillus cereus]PEV76580.1 hypothetical protein CN429_20150 [Bacillus cereus]PFA50003.1 hypothetical protein CN389_23950 [Bacillus cereus]PFD77836.1 hypothetical protein CN271_06980 [Bacillus cereus]
MLYSTPYLYSSEMLRQMYKGTNKEDNMYAIREHMLRHEVYLDQQYRGYYYLSQKIEDELFGDEHALSWNELLDDYQLYRDRKGNLSIKPKG